MCDAVYSYTSAELRELPLNTVMTGRHGDMKQQQDGNLHFTAHVDAVLRSVSYTHLTLPTTPYV